MVKIMKKSIVTMLTIIMVITMLPSSFLLGFAETVNGDDDTNTETIEERVKDNLQENRDDKIEEVAEESFQANEDTLDSTSTEEEKIVEAYANEDTLDSTSTEQKIAAAYFPVTMYDYDMSINGNAQLTFGPYDNRPNRNNTWNDYKEGTVTQGIVKNKLDDNGNIQFNYTQNGIFNPTNNGTTREVYTDVKFPFIYDSYEKSYEFDSSRYHVHSNKTNGQTLELYNGDQTFGSNKSFFPFNKEGDTNPNYYFGMNIGLDFYMTSDGKLEGLDKDITFEFSGDDDVWVFVDNQLVLDLGGIHQPLSGTINFAKQTVEYKCRQRKVTDTSNSTGTESKTVPFSQIDEDFSLKNLADGELHSLQIFYLERGAGDSNCRIKFNLPQPKILEVTKQLGEGTPITDGQFTFEVKKDGEVYANKTYTLFNGNSIIRPETTDSEGKLLLSKGQTAKFTDPVDGKYEITEIGSTGYDKSWTAKVNGSALGSTTGDTSPTVELKESTSGPSTGEIYDDLKEGKISYSIVCTNSNDIAISNDTIVLDYGKAVQFNVTDNDGLEGKEAIIKGIGQLGTNNTDKLSGVNGVLNITHGEKDGNGNAQLLKSTVGGNEITYTPDKYMSSIDKFTYAIEYDAEGSDSTPVTKQQYANVSVIPATSVYYEDNFGITKDSQTNEIIQTGGIYYNKNLIPQDVNSQTGQQSSANDSYGYDSSYENDNTDSNGSSTKITGNGSQAATFTFTGTGFDLIGRTATDTGNIMVNVYKGNTVGNTTDRISSHVINTVYSSGTLYQIPVYNWSCNDYKSTDGKYLTNGKYTVEIKVGNQQAFYLDAVRIYNPIDTTANTDEANTANSAYKDAKEANAQIKEIRQSLLTEGQLNPNGKGVVFVDSNGTVNTSNSADFDTYSNVGPNNEVYLAPDQSIGFNISSANIPETIQIGAKAPNGNTKFAVYSEGELVGGKELSTATDMYYKLDTTKVKFTDRKAYIMITNDGQAGSGIVSLTNIKLTFDNEQVNAFSLLSDEVVVSKTKAKTLELNKVEEYLQITSAKFDATSVKVKKESTLKVITSKDVDDVLILDENDKEVAITSKTSKVYSNSDQSKIFTVKIKHTTTGTKNYKVVAKGKSGATSENYVSVSIKVTKQSILDKFISWFR